MREIKFNLYAPCNGGMRRYVVTGIKYKRYGERDISEVYIGDSSIDGEYLKTGEAHLVQYTGLLDRNGKEIYEGDIVEYYEPNYDSSGGLIDYNTDYLVVKWNDVSNGFDLILDLYIQPRVIGNIYENPELLK